MPKWHTHAWPKHSSGHEAACRAHHWRWRGRGAAPVDGTAWAKLLLLRMLAESGSHRPKLHVAADAAEVEGGAGTRRLKQLHRLLQEQWGQRARRQG